MREFLSPCCGLIKYQGTCFRCDKCSAELQLHCISCRSLLPDTSGTVPTSCINCQQEITPETISIAVQQRHAGENAPGSCYDVMHSAKARQGKEGDIAADDVATGCAVNNASRHDAQHAVDRTTSSNSTVTDGSDIIEGDDSGSSEDDCDIRNMTGGIASNDSATAHGASVSSKLEESSLPKTASRRQRKNRKRKEASAATSAFVPAANAASGAGAANAASGAANAASGAGAANAASGAGAANAASGAAAAKSSSGVATAKGSANAAAAKASTGAAAAKTTSGVAAASAASGAGAANAASSAAAAKSSSGVDTAKGSTNASAAKASTGAAAAKTSGVAAAIAASGVAPAKASSGGAAASASSGPTAADNFSAVTAANVSSGAGSSSRSKAESTTERGNSGAESSATENFHPPADSYSPEISGSSGRGTERRDEALRKEDVMVTFEVVVPSSFCKDKPSSVHIEFYDNDKISRSYQLSSQQLSSNRNGWTTNVKLPRAKLWSVQYKYCAFEKQQRKVLEHIHRDDNVSTRLRSLELSMDQQNISHLYQYDLAMLPKKYPPQSGGLWKRFTAAMKKKLFNFDGHTSEQLFEDSLFGLECMLPDIIYCLSNRTMKGDDIITKIRRIVACVLKSDIFFLHSTGKWTDKLRFTEAIGLLFCSQLETCQHLRDDEHNHKPELFSCHRIICVLIMLVIMHDLMHDDVRIDLEYPATLMEHIDWRNVSVKTLLDEIRDNFKFHRQLYEVLGFFLNQLAEAGKASWLLGIPAYHALGPHNTSCDNLKFDRCRDYWGFNADLERAVWDFKKTVKESDIARLFDKLEHALDQQPLSARSLIGALDMKTVLSALNRSWRLPIDAYTPAVLFFRLYNVTKLERAPSQEFASAFEFLLTYVERRLVQLTTSPSEKAHQEVVISLGILSHAAIELEEKLTPDNWVCAVAFAQLAACLYRSAVRDKSTVEVCRSTRRTITSLVKGLTAVQQKCYCSTIPDNEVKMWEALHMVTWPDFDSQDSWTLLLNKSLASRINQLSATAKVNLYFNADSRNTHVKKILADAACSAADIVLQDPDVIKTDPTDVEKFTRCGWLLSMVFTDSWKKKETDADKIKFILLSSVFRTCFAFSRDARFSALEAECQECLAQCVSLFEDLTRKLKDGRLTYGIFGLLMKCKESFLQVHELLNKGGESSTDEEKDDFSFCLEHHRRQKQQFDEIRSNLEILRGLCDDLESVRIQDFDNLSKDFDEMEIRLLWRPAVTESGDTAIFFDCDPFKVVRRAIPPTLLAKVQDVHRSLIFTKLWKETYESNAKYEEEPDSEPERQHGDEEVLAVVLSTAHEQWQAFADRFKADSATFQDATRLLHYCGNDMRCVEREIQILVGSSEGEATGKLLQQYYQLLQCRDGAKAILEIKDRLRLVGDFSIVNFIVNMKENKECKLSSIPEVLHQAALQYLPDLGNECNTKCLVEFASCMDLVLWVQEHIRNPKELKVFVDLASIAAGEGDIEVEKVSCLHASITGFSPLIYDLHQTADLHVFLEKCRVVWRNLLSNTSLPDQLKATNDNIHWVRHIKDSYGSVEVSSLAQASAINESGIFEVGYIEENFGANSFSLEGVMRVTIPPTKAVKTHGLLPTNAGIVKTYNYSHLCELQSKLMLVAGKAEQDNPDVHIFMKMFASATRLANAYINMHNTGNILFDTWKARFYCGSSHSVNVHVEFGLAKKLIRGLSDTPCEDHAMQLAKFMEQCIEMWNDYALEKRRLFSELNFFTTQQIVFLRRELAKLLHKKNCDPKVYPLLSMARSCDREDVLKALDETDAMMVAIVNAVPEIQQEAYAQAAVIQREPCLSEEQQALLTRLLDFEINKELAMAALAACPGCCITDIFQWCQDKSTTSESAEATSKPVISNSKPISLERKSAETVHSLPSLLNEIIVDQEENFVGGVCALLTEIWSRYLNRASTSLNDFLSLDHLGHVLRLLVQKKVRMTGKRKAPPGMNRGRIWLTTCPRDAMLTSVMAVYAVDGRCPLPTRNEVLLCTGHTTTEEVGLFLERASTDDESIYCLAYADRLNYEACAFIERRVGDLQDCKIEYLIVVLCCEEKSLSPITTILERWKLNSVIVCDMEHIRKYVRQRLRVDEASRKVAAMLDNDQSSTRLIRSQRAGVGKSLYVQRTVQRLKREVTSHADPSYVYIPLLQHRASPDVVLEYLLSYSCQPSQRRSRIIHIDITPEVQEGVSELLFDLLILGSVCQKDGYVWQRSLDDYYMVEFTSFQPIHQSAGKEDRRTRHEITELLPSIECYSPQQCLEQYTEAGPGARGVLMDDGEFQSRSWQRVYQHLTRFDGDLPFTDVEPSRPEGTHQQMLEILLRHCGIKNPSWAELKYFVFFLNRQLEDCTVSSFCSKAAANELPGFIKFVVKFMLQMSKDFATRSLFISEESPHMQSSELQQTIDPDIVHGMTLKRRWEQSSHPYLFFNSDGHTVTFLGFCVDPSNGNIIEPKTRKVLENGAMTRLLFQSLKVNGVDLSEDFEELTRQQQVLKLCSIMGNSDGGDPDETYKLTLDNVKKLLAIYMRFRCGIPVVIMGETGCGKTRLVKFMCGLQQPRGSALRNLLLVKIHGGVTFAHLKDKVAEAYRLAKENIIKCPHMYTVLFLDEANTTDAIGLIKEVMCDGSFDGDSLDMTCGLRIVAAVNPYRKHPESVIKKLESAGLGYYVRPEDTADRFGSIPMRQLVYRVRSLPPSILPLVWDFGQLSAEVERIYILQMVEEHARNFNSGWLKNNDSHFVTAAADVLVQCQKFMRAQGDECCFVSLRDAERALQTMSWFLEKCKLLRRHEHGAPAENADDFISREDDLNDLTWSFVLALGVCYQACLLPQSRKEFQCAICPYFLYPLLLPGGERQFSREIEKCQTLVIDSLSDHIPNNIARNRALKENILMMIVCMELRIPLFLIGKPGSSKSLAKAILADAMQGDVSKGSLFKHLKQTHMVSFQCSPLATPEGIVGTFKQAARFQKSRRLDKFVSVVVLDEIGLAEDSKLMPLKTLHPLLEDGCEGDEEPKPYMKCAFIGISNWSLDPAKMNRGIMVQRGVPTRKELEESARGICQFDGNVLSAIAPVIPCLAAAYLDLFKEVATKREFFGLRDFYSLMKMVAYFANHHGGLPHAYEFQHAVRRNFGGSHSCNAVEVFEKYLGARMDVSNHSYNEAFPPCDAIGLIRSSLNGEYTSDGGESRYLLILTENYSVLNLIQGEIQKMNPQIIFGSSFPKDLLYTQVCRNINRIKVCMETGTPVLLLNLEHLYESLYDALNQYYVYYGGRRFVDLGLGTHRVKCRVHERFRLIVVARKDDVHNKYPIPLINRLEKHYISMNTMLTPEQKDVVQHLDQWAIEFTNCSNSRLPRIHQRSAASRSANPREIFVGLTPDTSASLVIKVTDEIVAAGLQPSKEEVQRRSEKRLLSIATPESVLRIKNSFTEDDYNRILEIYFKEQQHDSLVSYLKKRMLADRQRDCLLQVTTRSKLLSEGDVNVISIELNRACCVDTNGVELIAALQAMDTEHQFSERVRNFFRGKRQPSRRKFSTNASNDSLLLIQCEAGDDNLKLVECARHILSREYNATYEEDGDTRDQRESRAPLNRHVVLVIQVTHRSSFAGFYGGVWECVHIDDLRIPSDFLPDICEAQRTPLSQLLHASLQSISRCDSKDNNAQRQDLDDNGMGVKQLGIFELLKMCLHEAACRLRDSSSSSDRPQERIRILCDLLSVDDSMEFCHLVASSIVELFRSREHTSHRASHWLVTDAASEQSIARLGTFRRSLEDCLAKKIAPAFAAVIAYCDVNDGLDLVHPASDNYAPWVASLWLKIFASFCLSGSSMMVSFPEQCPSELPVLCKSATGQTFKSLFPFSWVIKEKLDVLSQQTSTPQGTRDVLEALLASDEEFGDKIRTLNKEQLQESIRRYAHDYLHMMHRCNDREEYELILSALLRSMRSAPVSNILDVHSCFLVNRPAIVRWSRLMDATLTAARTEIFANVRRSANNEDALWDTHAIDVMGLREVLRVLEKKSYLESRPSGEINPAKEWSSSVHRLHSITKEILMAAQDLDTHSNSCVVSECRRTWSRLEAVRLFVEYIVAPETSNAFNPPAFEMKHARLFLTALCDDKDFNPKTLSSFVVLEKFLTLCHSIAVTAIYGKDAARRNCYSCGTTLMRAVLLPCRHLVCSPCLHRFYQLNNQSMKCPQCSQTVLFGEAAVPANEHDRRSYVRLKQLMRHLSDLFIRLLSDLVFDGVDRPEEALLRHLLSYIIVSQDETNDAVAVDANVRALTTQLGIYIDASLVDPRPVVRSLLLQLILQSSKGQMDVVIATFFEKATAIAKQDSPSLDAELCTIFINSIEDYYYRLVNFVDHDNCRDASDSTVYTTSTLRRGSAAWHVFDDTSVALTVDTLSSLAKVRLALALVAGVLCQQILSKSFTSSTDEVIDVLRQFCDHAERHAHCAWPRIFLAKHMIRKRGASTVLGAMAEPSLRQLMPRELQKAATGETLSDPFVIGNNNKLYCAVRKAFSSCIIDGKPDGFDQYLRVVKAPDSTVDICVILTICSVITRTYYSSNADGLPKPQTINMLQGLIQSCPRIHNKELCEHVLKNSLPDKLSLVKDMGLPNAMIALLVLRLWAVLSHVSQRNSLLSPLSMILTQPRSMQGKFFPTMPHDQFQDIRHVMQTMVRQGENLTPYACPNGHIYYIGNCGRAASQRQCPDCQSNIGGLQHVLSSGNRQIDPQEDQTKPGHILGPVTTRAYQQNLAIAERDLTPASCCIARILLHMALYASSAKNGPQPVSVLISPTPPDVLDFLWKHICNDLNTMERTLNRSRDECVILLHAVIAGFMDISTSGNFDWDTQEKRRKWEAQLHQIVIAPCVQNCNERISAATEQLQADAHETGSTVALAKLLEEPSEPLDVGSLLSNAVFWRYRERPGLDHFLSELENYVSSSHIATAPHTAGDLSSTAERYAFLLKFLRSHELLAAVSHLPDVMATISLLHQEFSRKLSTHTMDHLSIDSFLATPGRSCSHLLEPMIKHFIDAWNAVRMNLVNHRFWFDGQQFLLPSEVCSVDMSFRSPVKMLLAGYRSLSLCPLALVTYLAKTHNDLLASYAQAFNEKIPSKVTLNDAKVVHLITTDTDTNLLSIILANCEYSLKVGEGTSVHYNYDAIQQQIVERMVQHKPLLRIPSSKSNEGELNRFLFHEDLTNGYKLEQLPKILQQEPLTAELKSKICSAYRNSVTDLSDSLSFVDQVIGFVITTRTPPDAHLCTYARDCLRMNYNSCKHGALENLFVKHVRSLWLLLSMERSRVLITHHLSANRATISTMKSEDCPWQTWFGDVNSRYAEGLPNTDNGYNEILEHLRRLNRTRIARSVLEILYEFIALQLSYSADRRSDMGGAAAEADEDDRYPVHYGLFSTLSAYAETFESPYQPCDSDTVTTLEHLSTSCPQLELRHALATWVTLNCIVNNEM